MVSPRASVFPALQRPVESPSLITPLLQRQQFDANEANLLASAARSGALQRFGSAIGGGGNALASAAQGPATAPGGAGAARAVEQRNALAGAATPTAGQPNINNELLRLATVDPAAAKTIQEIRESQSSTSRLDTESLLKINENQRANLKVQVDQLGQTAQGLLNIEDDATLRQAYANARQQLSGVVPNLPPPDDPNLRTFLENSAARATAISDQLDRLPRTPERQAQEIELRQAGATRVENNIGPQGQNFGDPPTDHIFARNQDGTVATEPFEVNGQTFFRPITIPIGEAAADAEQAAEAKEARTAERKKFANQVTRSIDKSLEIIDTAGIPVTGLGSLLSGLPGTSALDLSAQLDTIKANVGFDKLQALRDASPTGGALGQVSNLEIGLLQAVIASLDQAQSEDQLKGGLAEVKRLYLDAIYGSPEGQAAPTDLSPLDVESLLAISDNPETSQADVERITKELERRLKTNGGN